MHYDAEGKDNVNRRPVWSVGMRTDSKNAKMTFV